MKALHILGIESSCDDTSAAVVRDRVLRSNIIAGQEVHRQYGGVVPELASRAHQQHIVPVVDRVFPFGQLPAAKDYVESNAQVGKVVVTLS